MAKSLPNIIFSSFPRSGGSSVDEVLKKILPQIGYHITPFGIEGSANIDTTIVGKTEPFYHWTHAHLGLFNQFINKEDFCFIYHYRDPRECVVSWANKEIIEGNAPPDIDAIRQSIIFSKYHLTEHIIRAREWMSCENVLSIRFEDMCSDLKSYFKSIFLFIDILELIDPHSLQTIIEEVGPYYHKRRQIKEDRELQRLGITRLSSEKKKSWELSFSKTDTLLFKKIAGDFLIEYGYETNYDW